MSEVSMSESLTGAQSVAHTGYRYMRHPPEIINLPIPVENPCINDDLPHIIWKKIYKKKSPRDSLEPRMSPGSRRTDVNRNVRENVVV